MGIVAFKFMERKKEGISDMETLLSRGLEQGL
jgi:hypothetical protein